MPKKSVFISFDYDNDAHYKHLLTAWDKNDEFDFYFYDGSLKEAINSTNAAYIKALIKPKITGASRLLCIVGAQTSKSAWIDWEIQTAKEAFKPLIGVKISKDNISPAGLLGVSDTRWALSFTFDAIKKAIDES